MQRVLEPELMDDAAQALAYHQADFSVPHGERVGIFRRVFPGFEPEGAVLDLGCGSGDVLGRFARALPRARFTGVDGSQAMLDLAAQSFATNAGLHGRITLLQATLPATGLPREPWQLVMCHSLLHHLHHPEVLWHTIRELAPPGCAVFVADLRRPGSTAEARRIMEERSGGEPEVLRRDFYNSLCASFEPQEVREQLRAAGLDRLSVAAEGEVHLIVHGYV
jgi:2-polyprenyl-3-methyl-5-hydroxy-6-metoxy-1,4-benzoquinol methylase